MKKRITSFFAMALLFAGAANAQVEELQGLKAVEVGDEVMLMDQIVPETQWYAVYQQRNGGGYWWSAPAEYNAPKGYAANTVCMSNGTEVLEGSPLASTVAANIVRFLLTEEGYFNVQFGNGTYMMSAGHAGVVKYTENIAEAAQIRMYNITTEDGITNEGHWAFNFVDNDVRIDNNGKGNSVAGWGNGTNTSIGGNNDFQIYAINFVEVSELYAAINEAMNVHAEYVDYYNTFDELLNPGVPGNYDAAAVAAFQAALDAISVLDSPDGEEMTVEQIKAMAQAIKDTYEAVLASKIPWAVDVEEGYYLIQTSPFFYESRDTEDPSTGEIIPSTTYLSKGLYASPSGENFFAVWGTYDATAENRVVFLWKVTSKGDKKYQLRNMGHDVNTTYWTSSGNLYLNDVDSTVVFDYNPYVDGEGNQYYNIRPSQNKEREYNYLHCGGHGGGAGVNGWIVNWAAGNGSASEWKLIPVSEAEAQAMIDAYASLKAQEDRTRNTATILADVEPKIELAKTEEFKLGDAQIAYVDQFSSPYTEPSEGSIDALLDGVVNDNTNFWHSAWSGGNVSAGTHYLQVELAQSLDGAVFTFSRRPVATDQVTQWSVYGTDDSEAEKDACTLLATINTPYGSNTETLTSAAFRVGDYQYLRFYAEATNSNRGYFHLAEFQLYEAIYLGNKTMAEKMGDAFTNMEAAVAAAKAEQPIGEETYNNLVSAYEVFCEVIQQVYEDRYYAALDNANETAQKKMNVTTKDALQDVIDANTGLTGEVGLKDLLDASIALEDAVTTPNLAAKNYEDIKSALDKFVNLPSFDHIVKFTYRDAIEKGYNEGTLSDANNGESTKLRNEYRKYLQAIPGSYMNANALGTNVEIAVATKDNQTPPEGWTEIEGSTNKGTITVDNEDSDGLKNIFENRNPEGLSVGNMYTTVTGLPNGKYFLRAQAATSNSTTKDYVYIKSGDNEETGVLLNDTLDSAWICITEPIVVTNGTVELGLHVGSGDSWAQIGVVELKVYEIYDQTATNEVADNVQYGTISLPYAATTEANLYTVDALNGNLLVMTEVADGKLEAGKAYIYEGISATFSYVPEQNLTNTAEATGLLTGVLKPQTIAADNYVLQTQNGHKAFYRVVAGKEITGVLYRAYLTKPASAGVRDVLEFGDDTVTALDAIEALQNGKAEIYDVNGRKLQKLQKGVNIVNGAKIIVK